MIKTTRLSGTFGFTALLASALCVSKGPLASTHDKKTLTNILSTADIQPGVIVEGKVAVGRYAKIDAGTIITGSVTIRGTDKIGKAYAQCRKSAGIRKLDRAPEAEALPWGGPQVLFWASGNLL